MKVDDMELSELLDEIVSALGELLINHRELCESILDQQRTSQMQNKIDALKVRVAKEQEAMKKARDHQRRVKELGKISRSHGTRVEGTAKTPPRLVPVTDRGGRVVGWVRNDGNDRVTVLDRKGRAVAYQRGNQTLDAKGALIGYGKLGIMALSQSSNCKK